MKKLIFLVGLICVLFSCEEEAKISISEGIWLAELAVMDNEKLPFNFQLTKSETGDYQMEIFNASEVIFVDEIEISNDSIVIRTPAFEGYIAATFTDKVISGQFIKESLDRIVPFEAVFGEADRFKINNSSKENVSGVWETVFEPNTDDAYIAKGIFTQRGNKVTGTFRTTTGDYRYLQGIVSGDSLKISAFDGAHAFLFTAKVTDSSLNGAFYSGNHSKELFAAQRNDVYELPSADSLTFIKEGYDKFSFSFPNVAGDVVSLDDERYKNKVVIVQIMGTWCPNCLDESKYFTDYMKKNTSSDLEIVALAFEYAKTKEGAFKSIKRMKDRIGVEYPILLAQFGSSDKEIAQQKIPMLNHVLSYPTSIFIDKKGNVRKIHTGFNGPATGKKFIEFQKKFESFVEELQAE